MGGGSFGVTPPEVNHEVDELVDGLERHSVVHGSKAPIDGLVAFKPDQADSLCFLDKLLLEFGIVAHPEHDAGAGPEGTVDVIDVEIFLSVDVVVDWRRSRH